MSSPTYVQPKGREIYRGHVLAKFLVSLDGAKFWRVEVHALGLIPVSGKELAFVQYRTAMKSLEATVQAAKVVVGQMIFYGTEIPAIEIREDYLTRENDPFDALIMKSSTGKHAICKKHWAIVKAGAKAGNVNALVFSIRLLQKFLNKIQADGMFARASGVRDPYTINMMLDSYAPICCWLGEETFQVTYAESEPKRLLALATEASLR